MSFSRCTRANSASVSCLARLAVGSSMISTRASCASAFAISVSCQYAVPRSETTARGSTSTSMSLNTARARRTASRSLIRRPRPSGSLVRKMFWATVRLGTRLNSWKTMPMPGGPRLVDRGDPARVCRPPGSPLRRASRRPEGSSSGWTCRRRCLRRGRGPRPWRTSKSTSCRTQTPSKLLLIPRISTASWVVRSSLGPFCLRRGGRNSRPPRLQRGYFFRSPAGPGARPGGRPASRPPGRWRGRLAGR